MAAISHRGAAYLVVVLLILGGGTAFGQQTPGQITQFDPSLNVVDSVITQDPNGNIGIGTTTPVAVLDVATGDLNLDGTASAGNTFLGSNAGNLTMRAIGNTATGAFALYGNTEGNYNTVSGYGALSMNSIGSYNVASGDDALLHNTTGIDNVASGSSALSSNTTGFGNVATGASALSGNVTGYENTAIGRRTRVTQGDLHNATVIGANAVVDASNKIRLGNVAVTVIEGQVPYTFTSDKNQKENFQSVDGEEVLRKLGVLSLTSWNYIGHDPQQFRHYGPVAQEFFAAFGHDAVGTIGTPTTINSGDLEGILMIAVQAVEKQNRELRTRIEALERLVKGTAAGVQ
jgi:hypothetical protein